MTKHEVDRLKVLCEHYVAGCLTNSTLEELEQWLARDETARLVFLTYLEVHAGLGWEARSLGWGRGTMPGDLAHVAAATAPTGAQSADCRARVPALSSRTPLWWVGSLATVLVVLIGIWFTMRWPVFTGESIAKVRDVRHASGYGGRELLVGTELSRGLLDLQSGLLEIETNSRVTLILEGPAQMQLHDALHATLLRGNLVVRMAKGESGFVVNTPQMKVTDLGTEFGVSATPEGVSRVQVYEGKVRAEAADAAGLELVAGQMLSRQAGGALTPGTFKEDRFIRQFPPRRPGEDEGGVLYNRSHLEGVRVAALPSGKAVVIDGRLDEWDRSVAFRSACEPPFASTYHVEGMMMYDAANLYLAAHVGDPEPMRNAGAREGMEFAGGSVIVRLAADRELGWPLKGSAEDVASSRRKGTAPLPDSVSDRVANLILWHDARSGQARLKLAYGFDSHGTVIPEPGAGWSGRFVKDDDGRGYTVEFAIPWRFLHAGQDPPRAGDVLGALWMVHWSDADGILCRGQMVDITRPGFDREREHLRKIPPGSYFQFGPAWGRAEFLAATGR